MPLTLPWKERCKRIQRFPGCKPAVWFTFPSSVARSYGFNLISPTKKDRRNPQSFRQSFFCFLFCYFGFSLSIFLFFSPFLHSFFLQVRLHRAAGADPVASGSKEVFHFLLRMDSACRFDLHILSNVLFEKRNIREIRAFCREPGRCLDIIRPALCDAFARKDLLLFRQKAGLDDDLQHMIPDRLFDRRDFVRDVLRIPVFQRADDIFPSGNPATAQIRSPG